MTKRYNQGDNTRQQELQDDFEDFGYDVKNIKRSSKKKVAKFKREQYEREDSI